MAEIKTKAQLEAEIAELKAKLETKPEVSSEKPEDVAPVQEEKRPENTIPVPTEWAEAVKTTLNDKFKVEVDYSSDAPTFGLSILVPQEYSNAPKPHWDTYHEDRRTRVINNADGVGGVKQWVERVYNNFDNETKAKITSDRNLQA